MSQVTKEKPKTFSVVFDEAQFSEAPHSRVIAEQFQTDHHEIHLTENQLLGMLPAALAAMDQPTMDGVNTFVVSKAVKEQRITVAVSRKSKPAGATPALPGGAFEPSPTRCAGSTPPARNAVAL